MDARLIAAAEAGNIDTLYTLLTEDPLLFEKIDQFPFLQSPLHVAALAGHSNFVLELLNLKPSFTRKLNTDGYSPIHVAATVGHAELVIELLELDQELGLLKGREWRTPLHCAVINGRKEVVDGILSYCGSDVLKALTVRKETVLHLALKYGQLEIFDLLLAGVKSSRVEEILKWLDREGNTILHLAAYSKQFQVIETLLQINDFREVVDINRTNKSAMTALDLLRQQNNKEDGNVDIENRLRVAGAVAGQDIVTVASIQTTANNSKDALIVMERLFRRFPMDEWAREIEKSPSETRSALMVVSVLIATVTFQAVLSPPGGFNNLDYHNKWVFNEVTNMAADNPIFFLLFSIMNLIGFITSLAMITVLTRGFPLKPLLRLAVLSLAATYLCSIVYIEMSNTTVVSMLAVLMFLILVVQWFHLKLRSLKKEGKKSV